VTVAPSGADIPMNSIVNVNAEPNGAYGWFLAYWNAPGSLIDQSRETRDEFVLNRSSQTVQAIFSRSGIELPATALVFGEPDPPENPIFVLNVSGHRHM